MQQSSAECRFILPNIAPPGVYTLSLHDALPISLMLVWGLAARAPSSPPASDPLPPEMKPYTETIPGTRSEEHTSELQSRGHLVCRLLLEKKTPTRTPIRASAVEIESSNLLLNDP